jgi:rare lipoprotein A
MLSTLFLILVFAAGATAQTSEVGYASWYNRGYHGLATASGETYDHEAMTAAHPELAFGTMVRVARTDNGRSVVVRINDRMQSGPGHVIDLSGAAAHDLEMIESGVAKVRLEILESAVSEPAVTESGESQRPSWSVPAVRSNPETPRMIPASQTRPSATEEPIVSAADTDQSTATAAVERTQNGASYTLQLGAFKHLEGAASLAERFSQAWILTVPAETGSVFRVYFDHFEGEAPARAAQARLFDAGYDSFLRTIQ